MPTVPTRLENLPIFRGAKTARLAGTTPGSTLLALEPNGLRINPGNVYGRHRIWFGLVHAAMRTWEAGFNLTGMRQGQVAYSADWKIDGANDLMPASGGIIEASDASPSFTVNIRTQSTTTGNSLDCIPGPEGSLPQGGKTVLLRAPSNDATQFIFYTLAMSPFDISGQVDEWVLKPTRWVGSNIPATTLSGSAWAFVHFSVLSELRS